MRVLIVGSGGREHALAWRLQGATLTIAPGNPGTATLGRNVAIEATDIAGLVRLARDAAIELVIPGPEAPLALGLADALALAGIPCCGPTAAAARLESSKAFAKAMCDAAGIPTARWERFDDLAAAEDFVRRRGAPLVIKADGLAAGKGVTVAMSEDEALAAVRDTSLPLVIEERLEGDEISLFALCDGADAVLLGAAQDHKRAYDGDQGPNTGGMGAISPPADFDLVAQQAAMDRFVRPALAHMAAAGTPFRGILFAGLIRTAEGLQLIEYNVRLGDPEAQALLPRLTGDLLGAFAAAARGGLHAATLEQLPVATAAVVMAAPGYPVAPRTGEPIGNLAAAAHMPHAAIFHAGTRLEGEVLRSAGGRVLTVCGTGPTVADARAAAYAAVDAIAWPGALVRRDIGARALPA